MQPSRLLKSASVRTAGIRLTGGAVLLGYTVLVQRVLGLSEFGDFAYALALSQLINIAAGSGQNLALREVGRGGDQDPNATARVVRAASMLGLVAGIGAVPALVLLGVAVPLAALMSLQCIMIPVLFTLQGVARARGRHYLGQVPNELIRPVIAVVVTLLVMIVMPMDLSAVSAMAAYTFANALALIYIVLRLSPIGLLRMTEQVDSPGRSSIWQLGPLLGVSAATALSDRIDIILLGQLTGSNEVGLYALAQRTLPLLLLGQNVSVFLNSKGLAESIERRDFGEVRRVTSEITRLSLIGTVFVGVLAVGAVFLAAAIDDTYSDLRAIVPIFMLACLFNAVIGSSATVLVLGHQERQVTYGWAAAAAVIAVGCLGTITTYGTTGAAASFAAGTGAAAAIMYRSAKRSIEAKP